MGSRAGLDVLEKKKYLVLRLDKPQFLGFSRPYPSHQTDYTTLVHLTCSQDGGSGDDHNNNDDVFTRLLHDFKFRIFEYRTYGLGRWVSAYLLISNLTVDSMCTTKSMPPENASFEF